MFYKVIHHPTNKQGEGSMWPLALAEAIGAVPCVKFLADQQNLNFFQSEFRTATVLPPQNMQRRTVVTSSAVYEVAGIFTNQKRKNLLVTIYRAKHPETLAFLPEHATEKIATVAKSSRRKGKRTEPPRTK